MEIITTSVFFGTALTLVAYFAGVYVKEKTKLEIFNPILIGICVVIMVLTVFDVEYEVYNKTASHISYFLTPATICLSIPLYRQFQVLKQNVIAIVGGVISGVLASCISTFGLAVALSLTQEEYLTMLPKSITTAIGLPLSEELGGIGDITVTLIILTGIFGNLIAISVLKLFRINHPIAKGIAIGSSSHALGTVKALEIGEIEGAMSSLSIALSGIITVLAAQFFAQLTI